MAEQHSNNPPLATVNDVRLSILRQQVQLATGKPPTAEQEKEVLDGASPRDILVRAGLERTELLPIVQTNNSTQTELLPKIGAPARHEIGTVRSHRKPPFWQRPTQPPSTTPRSR